MSVLTFTLGSPGDPCEGCFPAAQTGWAAKVRVRPVPGLARGWGGGAQSLWGLSRPLPSLPSLLRHLFPFRSLAGALRQGNKSSFPPSHCHLLGFHTLGVSGRRELLPFSQCLRCAPSGPPEPGILFAADVTGLRSRRGWGGPAAAGRELSGKGPELAAAREFDGLLCRPRGSFLIPLCVPAHSPLTLSDKLLSRRPPGRGKKGPHSGRTLNPRAVGPGRGARVGGSGGGGSRSGKKMGDRPPAGP